MMSQPNSLFTNQLDERVCWDNAMSQSFWSTLKTEFYHRHTWQNRQQAAQAVAAWIEEIYNRKRLHSQIAMRTPVEYEQQLQAKNNKEKTKLTQAA